MSSTTLSNVILSEFLPDKERYLYAKLVEGSVSHQIQKGYTLFCIACGSPQENKDLIYALCLWLSSLMTDCPDVSEEQKSLFVSYLTKFTKDVVSI